MKRKSIPRGSIPTRNTTARNRIREANPGSATCRLEFLLDFERFQSRISVLGMYNSLAQTLVRATAREYRIPTKGRNCGTSASSTPTIGERSIMKTALAYCRNSMSVRQPIPSHSLTT